LARNILQNEEPLTLHRTNLPFAIEAGEDLQAALTLDRRIP
jgi:hypothetical protein